jgi:hypothetical protein
MTTPQEILAAVATLKEEDRFLLMEQLIECYSPVEDDLSEDDFLAELKRRKADFENGTANAISWEELRNER